MLFTLFLLYVYFVPYILQQTYVAFLGRESNWRDGEGAGGKTGVACPEALCLPRSSPDDQNSLLGRRIFLVLIRMFQAGSGRPPGQLEGHCACPHLRAGVSFMDRGSRSVEFLTFLVLAVVLGGQGGLGGLTLR